MINIVVNKNSGKGNGARCLATAEQYLKAQNIEYAVHPTQKTGDGETITRRLCEAGEKTVIAMGGDGTFHEVLNGANFDNGAAIGFIPSGHGNDYAQGCNISTDCVTALKDILQNNIVNNDYIQVSNRRCLNVAGTGLDVAVLERTYNKNNSVTYITSLAMCLLSLKPFHFHVESDAFPCYDGKAVMVGVCNGSQFGGGIKLSPTSKNNDGLLEVVIMEKPKRIPVIMVMPDFIKGKHIGKRHALHFSCTKVSIDTDCPLELDGEIYRDLKFEASIVKDGLRTFATGLSK